MARAAARAAVVVGVAAGACGRTPDIEPLPRPGRTAPTRLLPVFTQTVNNDIDIVFMIDNSRSMEAEQANLRRNFPVFTSALKNLPQGLPNVHIGVVSSSLGAGSALMAPGGCPRDGDGGRFQGLPRALGGRCTAVPRGNFISAVGAARNFDGDIDQVFSCIAELGTGGCGFEHQLQSIRRALDPETAPPENRGFLREDAVLAVILLTDEDDCSAPPNTDLFRAMDDRAADPRGPLSSFRCAEFGHRCGGARVPRSPTAGPLADCHSAEDGVLIRIAELSRFLKSLKADPNDVMVAAIAGPPAPYAVTLGRESTSGGGGMQAPLEAVIAPSCTSANGSAAPAVRINDFVAEFGVNGSFFSICADDFSPVMAGIGAEVARRASLECLAGPVADVDPGEPGLQAHCQVYEETSTPDGKLRTQIPDCASGGSAPCWTIEASAKCAGSGHRMSVNRGGVVPPPGTRIQVVCETCDRPGDPRCL